MSIVETLDEAQIDMLFPTQVLRMRDQTEAFYGVRTKQSDRWHADNNPLNSRSMAGTNGYFEKWIDDLIQNHNRK